VKFDNAQIDYQQFFKSLHLEGEVSNTLMSVFTSHFNTVSGAPSISKYAFCPFFVVRWKNAFSPFFLFYIFMGI
jgi:hypothetical protein